MFPGYSRGFKGSDRFLGQAIYVNPSATVSLLQTPTAAETVNRPIVSQPITSSVLRSFSKKYVATSQLFKQLLAQLEKSKKKTFRPVC